MKKIFTAFVLIGCSAGAAVAQDNDWTTYFGEKNGFEVSFPPDWNAGLTEKKVITYITSVVGIKADMPGTMVMINTKLGCKNPKSEIKTWISVFQKNAKKEKDDKFLIHDQGEGTTADGKDFAFIDYTFTLTGDDGSKSVQRRKFYITCHNFKMNKNEFSFFFQSLEQDWDKVSGTYEKIFASTKYK